MCTQGARADKRYYPHFWGKDLLDHWALQYYTSFHIARFYVVLCSVTQPYPTVTTLCDPVDCVAHQAPLSMGFSRQQYCNGLTFSTPGDLPNTGIKPGSLESPALAGRFFTSGPPGKLQISMLDSVKLSSNLEIRVSVQFSSVQSLSHVRLFATPWIAARQASLSEKAMAPHSSTLAWKIPWTGEPGGLLSWGGTELDITEQLHFHFSLSCIGEGNGNPLQCSYLENPKDRGAWWAAILGSHRVRHDWSDLAAAAAAAAAGVPVHHQLPEFTQTHIHRVSDAIQPSHPLLSPSPPTPNPQILPLKMSSCIILTIK